MIRKVDGGLKSGMNFNKENLNLNKNKIALCGLFIFLLVPWISSSLSSIVSQEYIQILGLIVSLISMVICLSAYNQSRMLLKGDQSRYGQYISFVFFSGGMLELMLFLYYGKIMIKDELLIDFTDVLLIIFLARLQCVLAMLFVGFKSPIVTKKPYSKWAWFTVTILYFSCVMFIIYHNSTAEYFFSDYTPLLKEIKPTHYYIHTSLLLFFLFSMAGLSISQIKHKWLNEVDSELMLGIYCLVLSQSFILQVHFVPDFSFILSMVCHVIAYIIFQKIYCKVYIERPLKEQKITKEKLEYKTHYDETTGLKNRRSLLSYVSKYLERSEDHNSMLCLLVISINQFKIINDSYGYKLGDQLLKQTGERLQQYNGCKKEVFSLGGARYAVVLTEVDSVETMHNRIYDILKHIQEPMVMRERELYITTSAVISLFPYDGVLPDELLLNAITALHYAEDRGHDFSRYSSCMKRVAKESLELEHDIRKGLERGEFFLEYQPQINISTNEVVGVEALVRWNHPTKGRIAPAEFIPVAEECGLIVPLGEWVLKEACLQNCDWQEQGYKPLSVSVNLSFEQFQQVKLAERIRLILKDTGLDPKYLELELTESVKFDVESGMKVLESIKELGVQISIDDFGTGYSSLHYLKKLPINRLKIDQSFVRELKDYHNKAIVSTITSMAKHLQLKVTAEGVENEDQLQFLQENFCHEAQGYYFSKPLSPADFEMKFLNIPA